MPVIATGIRGQTSLDDRITITGTIASGGTAQLLLPQQPRRLSLEICNNSSGALSIGIGPATATATVSSGGVASIAVNNAGIGYTLAPKVIILGGLVLGDLSQSPAHPATATATLTGSSINTITMDDVGAGYIVAPTIYLMNPLPQLGGGAFAPSGTVGTQIATLQTYTASGLLIPASAVAIWGASTSQAFTASIGGLV